MGQSMRHSMTETCCNVFSGMIIGFSISQTAHYLQCYIQLYIWSGFIWQLSWTSNIIMTIILTIASLIRGYAWRRVFNNLQLRQYKVRGTK
jgi:hypothetical protein